MTFRMIRNVIIILMILIPLILTQDEDAIAKETFKNLLIVYPWTQPYQNITNGAQ